MLSRLVTRSDRGRFQHRVISMREPGEIAGSIEAAGVPVASLHMKSGITDPRAAVTLRRLLQQDRPDVLQSWMFHANLLASGTEGGVQACVADKGYHATALIAELTRQGIRTYIPERKQRVHRWADKPEGHEAAFRANRRRVSGARGRRWSRWRSERCERTFAHVCETAGGARDWYSGTEEVGTMYGLRIAAYIGGVIVW